jgi:hypothetical protein
VERVVVVVVDVDVGHRHEEDLLVLGPIFVFVVPANSAAGGGSGHSWYNDVDNDGSFFGETTSWERIATGDQRSTPTRTTALRWRSPC